MTRVPLSATATFSFANPIDAFGFYLTGLGADATFSVNFFDGTFTVQGAGLGFEVVEFFGFQWRLPTLSRPLSPKAVSGSGRYYKWIQGVR